MATVRLLDQSICTENQASGQLNPNRFGCPQIDYKIKTGWLLDRHFGWIGTAKNSYNLPSDHIPIDLYKTRAITKQSICFGHFRPLIDCGKLKFCDALEDNLSVIEKKCRCQHVERR